MTVRRIKAIETSYAGCRFRSRTEARWAVLFDAMNWSWDFEPQGFKAGRGYLPDFLLRHPAGDWWFEVKPFLAAPDQTPEDPRWAALAAGTGMPVMVAYGMHRPGDGCTGTNRPMRHAGRAILPGGGSRVLRAFWAEPVHDRAWAAANGARFEHGESGAPGVRPRKR